MRKILGRFGTMAGITASAAMLVAASGIPAQAQTFTTLYSFDSTDGANPRAGVVQATDGNLDGTTASGGAAGSGTVFKLTLSGTLTTLYSFCSQSGCTDGGQPYAPLIHATDGNFYGTTEYGGANGPYDGTVFRITPTGTLNTLYSFCSQSGCADGEQPAGALVQVGNGNFYGATFGGGANGGGTIFKITPSGTLTTLYNFCSEDPPYGCTDGWHPRSLLGATTDGNLYGTTSAGGAGSGGTIFKITPSGALTTLYSFCSESSCADGEDPNAGLVQATDGNFYGTTALGGAAGGGTVFKLTPSGTLTTLYSFVCAPGSCADGEFPGAGLVLATDGNLYGTTNYGGPAGWGTVFRITPTGTLTTLHRFAGYPADGANPEAALVQATNGKFYGTTAAGGPLGACTNGCGTVFSLAAGLGPFVEIQPTCGKVGQPIKIVGTNLTGAAGVTFAGMPAVFTVVSSALIKAIVPVGAASGAVQVTLRNGTLFSNVPFRVLP
ncbi:MAG TPA: choice-of-anchor tandem repeat GloVer-containing protein [Terriglobia bacterium]